jgi:hypothetical protein
MGFQRGTHERCGGQSAAPAKFGSELHPEKTRVLESGGTPG